MPLCCPPRQGEYEKVKNLSLDFLRQHPVSPNARQCDLCQIFDILMKKDWTLSFQGDSVMRQNVVGLRCDLLRRGFRVNTTSQRTGSYKNEHGLWEIITHTIHRGDLPEKKAVVRYFAMNRPYGNMTQVRKT